jgi:hypothetical protein
MGYLEVIYNMCLLASSPLNYFVDAARIKTHLQKLGEYLIVDRSTHIKYFYFIHAIEEQLGVAQPPDILDIR